MTPTIGRIVIYNTTQADRDRMSTSYQLGAIQNTVNQLPAVITNVFSESCVNVKVFVDGHGNDLWKTSIMLGPNEGSWSWPVISK